MGSAQTMTRLRLRDPPPLRWATIWPCLMVLPCGMMATKNLNCRTSQTDERRKNGDFERSTDGRTDGRMNVSKRMYQREQNDWIEMTDPLSSGSLHL